MANYCFNEITVHVTDTAVASRADLLKLHTALASFIPKEDDDDYEWFIAIFGEAKWGEVSARQTKKEWDRLWKQQQKAYEEVDSAVAAYEAGTLTQDDVKAQNLAAQKLTENAFEAFMGGFLGYGPRWVTLYDVDEIDEESASFRFRFDSANTPALGLSEELSKLYPSLKFSQYFDEIGSMQAGEVAWQAGTVLYNYRATAYMVDKPESDDEYFVVTVWEEDNNTSIAIERGIPYPIAQVWKDNPEVMIQLEKVPISPPTLTTLLSSELGKDETFLSTMTERSDWEELSPLVAKHFGLPEELPAEWIREVL